MINYYSMVLKFRTWMMISSGKLFKSMNIIRINNIIKIPILQSISNKLFKTHKIKTKFIPSNKYTLMLIVKIQYKTKVNSKTISKINKMMEMIGYDKICIYLTLIIQHNILIIDTLNVFFY